MNERCVYGDRIRTRSSREGVVVRCFPGPAYHVDFGDDEKPDVHWVGPSEIAEIVRHFDEA